MGTFNVQARIFPTEDPLKVSAAIINLFPDSSVSCTEDTASASVNSVDHLAKLLTDQKTRYSFLDALNSGCSGNRFSVRLNKQAASVSRVNVVDEPKPLGWLEFSGEVWEPVVYFEKLLDAAGYISARSGHRHEGGQEVKPSARS